MNNQSAPKCPECGNAITGDDINVSNNIAYCRVCNVAHKFSTLLSIGNLTDNIDINSPPGGVRLETHGNNLNIDVSNRSIGTAIGMLFFALFWNGIVSIFVLLVTASTLQHLNVPIPVWFPMPVTNEDLMDVRTTVFMWVFLTPFIIIGVTVACAFLFAIGGKTKIHVSRGLSYVFKGIGSVGYRKNFKIADVSDVSISESPWQSGDSGSGRRPSIVIETNSGKKIRFGTMFTSQQQNFIAVLLYKTLITRDAKF
ncbi:MAG: hypothetical protein GX804_03385 [Lentisphaerae bacterium]|jgi:hypothetical protein|nr:hypothetical protein [Lentisphaerota bacterium]